MLPLWNSHVESPFTLTRWPHPPIVRVDMIARCRWDCGTRRRSVRSVNRISTGVTWCRDRRWGHLEGRAEMRCGVGHGDVGRSCRRRDIRSRGRRRRRSRFSLVRDQTGRTRRRHRGRGSRPRHGRSRHRIGRFRRTARRRWAILHRWLGAHRPVDASPHVQALTLKGVTIDGQASGAGGLGGRYGGGGGGGGRRGRLRRSSHPKGDLLSRGQAVRRRFGHGHLQFKARYATGVTVRPSSVGNDLSSFFHSGAEAFLSGRRSRRGTSQVRAGYHLHLWTLTSSFPANTEISLPSSLYSRALRQMRLTSSSKALQLGKSVWPVVSCRP